MSKLVFVGDVFLPREFRSEWMLDETDGLIVNLEYCITDREQGLSNKVWLRARESFLEATFGRRPLAACLANNHVMDFGEPGLLDTMRRLDALGIKHYGAGSLSDRCGNPLVVKCGSITVAILGYVAPYIPGVARILAREGSLGVRPLDPDLVCEDIHWARSTGANRVIVTAHWGAQEVRLPLPRDVLIAHEIIDAGADLIIGHHAHCIQGFEVYKGKYIFYGLGNCIMPDLKEPAFWEGRISTYIKKQRVWNRRSIAVRYNPINGDIDIIPLIFDGQTLRPASFDVAQLKLSSCSLEKYERKFNKAYIVGKFRALIADYINRPKIPHPRQVRVLLEVMKKADRLYDYEEIE